MSEHASFFQWNASLDPVATATAYERLPKIDPQCCSSCVTLLYAIHENALPPEVARFLKSAGVDSQKAVLVCGSPEEGSLDASWIIIGELHGGRWDGRTETAFMEPVVGFKCWLADVTMIPPAFAGQELFQLEFEWRGLGVQELHGRATTV
jgi:hypothetical protein